MKIYIVERNNNVEITNFLKDKYFLSDRLQDSDVVVVYKIKDIKGALDSVDYALDKGKEVICIRGEYSRENYVANYLIRDGAMYI